MVGVAGKSKGCSTCRRRKKGCDLARPACGQCVKSGNVCGGYQRDLTFIHHKPPARQRQLPVVPDQSSNEDSFHFTDPSAWSLAPDQHFSAYLPSPQASSCTSPDSSASADDRQRDDSALVLRRGSPSPSLPSVPASLTLTALTSLHVSLFQPFYLPRNPNALKVPFDENCYPGSWINLIPSFVDNDPGLQLAYLALTSSRVGHDCHDDNLVASGKTFYGKALCEMQRALSDPRRRQSKETLSACSTLALYEIYEAQSRAETPDRSRPNGWLSHAGGVTNLLAARGPDAYATGVEHRLFLHARMLIAIRSCSARKATFLAERPWLTKPWQNHPKDMHHKLVDIMVFIPLIQETHDNLEVNENFDSDSLRRQRKLLLTRCCTLANHLRSWYGRLSVDKQGKPLWNTSVAEDPSYPFPQRFSFDDTASGNMLLTYWVCSLIVHWNALELHVALADDLTDDLLEEPLPDYINPHLYAINISQSLLFFLDPDMGALGPGLALFPMGMAFGYLANPDPPHHPPFPPSGTSIQKRKSIIDRLIYGHHQDPQPAPRIAEIRPWYMRLFTDLRIRNMPGGTFLSTLMRDVGHLTKSRGLHSIVASID